MSDTDISDQTVGELIDLARSAHVYFDLVNGRVTVRAVNPDWSIWRPLRYLLDEIGQPRIEAYLRNAAPGPVVASWPRPHEAMTRWAAAAGYRA